MGSKNRPAIEGGEAVREMPLNYAHQWIDEEDIRAVTEVLRSDFLTCGPKIQELEEELCRVTGAKFAVACANGTAALHIACQAAGLKAGEELVTTPMTFAASANCALYVGARPVFADIDESTWNLDPAEARKALTPRTKVILPVDFTGQAAELSAFRALADEAGACLIEDAAHSLGTLYEGKPVGSIADMTTFSFHAVKTVTGGEGGAVTTNDESLYRKLLLFRTHGITRDTSLLKRPGLEEESTRPSPDPWYYEQQELAMNYRMTELQAALILSQLKKLPLFKKRRAEIVARYDEAFSAYPEILLQRELPASDTARHLYLLRIDYSKLRIGRREFFDALLKEGVRGNVHYVPVYRHPYYEALGYAPGLCPKAEKLYAQIVTLPLYYGLTDGDVGDVIAAVTKLVEWYRS